MFYKFYILKIFHRLSTSFILKNNFFHNKKKTWNSFCIFYWFKKLILFIFSLLKLIFMKKTIIVQESRKLLHSHQILIHTIKVEKRPSVVKNNWKGFSSKNGKKLHPISQQKYSNQCLEGWRLLNEKFNL